METVKIDAGNKYNNYALKVEDVLELVKIVLAEHNLKTKQPLDFGMSYRISFEIERSWGVSCRFSWDNGYSDWEVREKLAKLNPEIIDTIQENKPRIELGWSSTGRTIPMALSAVDLYTEVIKFAADFECRLNSACDYIIMTKGV